MANEAVLIFETERPIPFTVENTLGIEKGAVLKLIDPMTVSGSAIAGGLINQQVAGIASAEKIASDGITKIGVYRKGIFKMALSGAALIGAPLKLADVNFVIAADNIANASGARIIGTALETGTNNETILVDLNIGAGGSP